MYAAEGTHSSKARLVLCMGNSYPNFEEKKIILKMLWN